jgi:hypothetical protein
MSLEEFGDRQKAEALERQAQQPEDGAAHANRRYVAALSVAMSLMLSGAFSGN